MNLFIICKQLHTEHQLCSAYTVHSLSHGENAMTHILLQQELSNTLSIVNIRVHQVSLLQWLQQQRLWTLRVLPDMYSWTI